MLRLEVDARLLRAGGIGRFIRETTSRWMKSRSVVALRLLGRPEELEPWLLEVEGADLVEIVPWRARPYQVSGQVQWPTSVRNGRGWEPDVTLFLHCDIPIVCHPRPSVTVVHDLIYLELPDLSLLGSVFSGQDFSGGLIPSPNAQSRCLRRVAPPSHTSLAAGYETSMSFPTVCPIFFVRWDGKSTIRRWVVPHVCSASRLIGLTRI